MTKAQWQAIVDACARIAPWFRPSKQARGQTDAVLAGRHPIGLPLGERGTCGTCVHHQVRPFANTYHKCDLTVMSGGPATDIRLRWPGCVRWEPGPPEPRGDNAP